MTLKVWAVTALVIVITTLAACGRPTLVSCAWVEPAPESGFVVTAPRKPISSACSCTACAAPGEFRLARSKYVIELWNGEEASPMLAVRAMSADATPLHLESDQLRCDSTGSYTGLVGFPCRVAINELNDFPPNPQFGYPHEISLTLRSVDGAIVGRETFNIRLESRSYRVNVVEF